MENKNLSDKKIERINPFIIKGLALPDSNNSPKHPYVMDGFVFVLCIKGKSVVRLNLREYELKENMVLTILPNHTIEIISQSEDAVLETLFLKIDLLLDMPPLKKNDLPELMSKYPCVSVTEGEMKNLIDFYEFIAKQYTYEYDIDFCEDIANFQEDMLKGLLYSFMARIGIVYTSLDVRVPNQSSSRQDEIMENFIKLLRVHHKEKRNAEFYADKMSLTRKYLSTTVKKASGKPVLAWINESIILEAKVLLKTSSLTITQLSEELNFPNPSFFGRLFKQHTGITPMKYREK